MGAGRQLIDGASMKRRRLLEAPTGASQYGQRHYNPRITASPGAVEKPFDPKTIQRPLARVRVELSQGASARCPGIARDLPELKMIGRSDCAAGARCLSLLPFGYFRYRLREAVDAMLTVPRSFPFSSGRPCSQPCERANLSKTVTATIAFTSNRLIMFA